MAVCLENGLEKHNNELIWNPNYSNLNTIELLCDMKEQVQSMESAPSCQLPDAIHLRTPQESMC